MFAAWIELVINISSLPKQCQGLQSPSRVCWLKGILFCSLGWCVSFVLLVGVLEFTHRSAGR